MTQELKTWLYTPCSNEDLVELKDQVFYMPIGVVKKKIQFMEDNFNVKVSESDFRHFLFNTNNRETIASGSIQITIYYEFPGLLGNSLVTLIGTATFPISKYDENTHYAATLESLCIVNAFGGKYPQFGSALNKFDVVQPDKGLAVVPKAELDKVTEQLFKKVKTKLSKFQYQEDAHAYLETTEWKHNLELKAIVNSLPTKS